MTSMLSSKRNCVSRLPYFQCVSPFPETMLESPLSRVELCIRKPVSKPGSGKGKRKTEPQERNRLLGHAAPAFGAHGHSACRIRHTRSNASGQAASVWETLTLGRAAGARGRAKTRNGPLPTSRRLFALRAQFKALHDPVSILATDSVDPGPFDVKCVFPPMKTKMNYVPIMLVSTKNEDKKQTKKQSKPSP